MCVCGGGGGGGVGGGGRGYTSLLYLKRLNKTESPIVVLLCVL